MSDDDKERARRYQQEFRNARAELETMRKDRDRLRALIDDVRATYIDCDVMISGSDAHSFGKTLAALLGIPFPTPVSVDPNTTVESVFAEPDRPYWINDRTWRCKCIGHPSPHLDTSINQGSKCNVCNTWSPSNRPDVTDWEELTQNFCWNHGLPSACVNGILSLASSPDEPVAAGGASIMSSVGIWGFGTNELRDQVMKLIVERREQVRAATPIKTVCTSSK